MRRIYESPGSVSLCKLTRLIGCRRMGVFLAAVVLSLTLSESSAVKIRRDTYLTAYMETRAPGLSAGEVYGAPGSDYGAPSSDYGAPSSDYGAPAGGYNYTPATGYTYEPHSAPENPLDPLHAKLVLLFKVLLKVLIFKLIVKFIAIICVFLFLPKLSGLGLVREAKEGARNLLRQGDQEQDEQLRLVQFVVDSVSGTKGPVCRDDSLLCRTSRALELVDSYTSVPR
ncbi:hypothetical protein J6590_098365 [Homalodisca vitripennis]|nr:hypothetical protein J6590_098365 [Homalodisca vitripennis]